MFRFLQAHNTVAVDDIDCSVKEHEIMKNYVQLLRKNQIDVTGHLQMQKNLEETLHRLLSKTKNEHETMCTCWIDDKTLYFNPKLIDMYRIEDEQYSSLVIMHKCSHPRIKIIIDAEKLTMWNVLKMSEKASFTNIVDGLRLWSTIPYKIYKIFVISPKSNIINQIVNMFLSKKIKERTHVFSSREKFHDSFSLFTNSDLDIEYRD